MENNFVERSHYENSFWLSILRDHTRFMFNSFSPIEKELIQVTLNFMKRFDEQLSKALSLGKEKAEPNELRTLNEQSYDLTSEFLNFQQLVLEKRLRYTVNINMTPTFLEHMIKEGKEFLRQLSLLQKPRYNERLPLSIPAKESMHQNQLWVPDAAGHAAIIQADLDMTEKELIKQAMGYQKLFEGLFIKTYELKGMIKPEYDIEPPVVFLNEQSVMGIRDFMEYLCRLKELLEEKKILSMLSPLMPDHMLREEQYYINKLKAAYPTLKV